MAVPTVFAILWLPLAGCGGAVEEKAPRPVNPVFDAYIELQAALAADSAAGAREAAGRLAGAATGPLAGLAEVIAVSAEIEAQRTAFMRLSEAMIESGPAPAGYTVVHCPMADENSGAEWLQPAGPVRNPYFGSDMLSCGTPVTKRPENRP